MLIPLTAAKRHLKIPAEETRDDAELTAVVEEASDVILVYLKRAVDAPVWDETTTPPRIQAAVKLMLGYLWTARDDQAEAERTWKAITWLLERDRDPAFA
jgi:hypothetical protein